MVSVKVSVVVCRILFMKWMRILSYVGEIDDISFPYCKGKKEKEMSRDMSSYTVSPTTKEITTLCDSRIKKVTKDAIESLKMMYLTHLFSIVREMTLIPDLIDTKLKTGESLVNKAMGDLYGHKFAKRFITTALGYCSLPSWKPLVTEARFKKMVQETLQRLNCDSDPKIKKYFNKDLYLLLQIAAQHVMEKAYIDPLHYLSLQKGQKSVKLEDLRLLNGIYSVSGSNFYSPALTQDAATS